MKKARSDFMKEKTVTIYTDYKISPSKDSKTAEIKHNRLTSEE